MFLFCDKKQSYRETIRLPIVLVKNVLLIEIVFETIIDVVN